MIGLSQDSRFILSLIAEGNSVGDILANYPHFTASDVANAAQDALRLSEFIQQTRSYKTGDTNPRTYEVWTRDEDKQLEDMLQIGSSIQEIGKALERHPMVIRRRMKALELAEFHEK